MTTGRIRLVSILSAHRKALFPLLLDLVYISGLIASIAGSEASGLVLVGLVGIGVNLVASYRLFVAGKGYFPFWWFLPSLLFPWASFCLNRWGALEQGEGETGRSGQRFSLSTTILCALIAALLLASSFFGPVSRYADRVLAPLDEPGQDYLLRTSRQVGIAFATARLLNGMLSLAEEMEVSAGVGVGATVSPGEVLEPLDDLVERFSVVMLVNFATVNAILLLGELGRLIGLALLAPLGIFVLAVSLWLGPESRGAVAGAGYKLVVLGLFLRFFVPAIGMGSIALDWMVLDRKQADAVQKMPEFVRERVRPPEAADAAGGVRSGVAEEEEGEGWWLFSGLSDMGGEIAKRMGEIRDNLAELKDSMPRIIESITEQIVIFVIKSIVLPLIFLLILLRFYRWITGSPRAGSAAEGRLKKALSGTKRDRDEAGEAGQTG